MSAAKKNVVVAISGRGMNLAALIEAARDPAYPVKIAGVVSDNAEARGLVVAQTNGVPAQVVARGDFASREDHDAAIHEAFSAFGADIVALAGYMRMLTPVVVDRWLGRMINIHPALLPAFRGLDTHRRAIEAGVRIHGCTVHFVTQGMDEGPVVAQAAVPVLLSDDPDSLAARVLRAELKLYPAALAMVADGTARFEHGRTVFSAARREREPAALLAPEMEPGAVNIEDLARFTP